MPKAQVVEDAAQVAGQDAAEMFIDAVPDWVGEWKIDLSGWTTMEHVMRWQDVVRDNEFRAVTAELAKLVRRWPYAHDPSKVESYGKLTPGQWRKAAEQVAVAAGDFFQNARD